MNRIGLDKSALKALDEYLEYRRFVLTLEPVGYCLVPFDFPLQVFLLQILFSACCSNNIVDARRMHANVTEIILNNIGFLPFLFTF